MNGTRNQKVKERAKVRKEKEKESSVIPSLSGPAKIRGSMTLARARVKDLGDVKVGATRRSRGD